MWKSLIIPKMNKFFIIVGAALLLVGIINVTISLINYKAKGFNITRLKFVVYSFGLLILGLTVLIRGFFST